MSAASHWERSCLSKKGYRSEIAARNAGFVQCSTWHTQGFRADAPEALYVYQCDVCGDWHLTRQPRGTPAITAAGPIARAPA